MESINAERNELDQEAAQPAPFLGRAFKLAEKHGDQITKLSRYERTIQSSLSRSIRDLLQIQHRRLLRASNRSQLIESESD